MLIRKSRIYTVNTVRDIEVDKCYIHHVVYHCVGVRVPGYYTRFRDAKRCIEENWGDIYEYLYDYACIEEVEEGLYPIVRNKWWYKWDDEKEQYVEFDIKELGAPMSDSECSFSIG